MNKQEFADKLTDFLIENDLYTAHCVSYIGDTSAILDVCGDNANAKQLLSNWLSGLFINGQIIYYREPEVEQSTLRVISYVTFCHKAPASISAEYVWCVYSDFDSVIYDTLQEALKELRTLNKETGASWKLKQIKTEEL